MEENPRRVWVIHRFLSLSLCLTTHGGLAAYFLYKHLLFLLFTFLLFTSLLFYIFSSNSLCVKEQILNSYFLTYSTKIKSWSWNINSYSQCRNKWALFKVKYLCNGLTKWLDFFSQYRYIRIASFLQKSAQTKTFCLGRVYKKMDFAVLQ